MICISDTLFQYYVSLILSCSNTLTCGMLKSDRFSIINFLLQLGHLISNLNKVFSFTSTTIFSPSICTWLYTPVLKENPSWSTRIFFVYKYFLVINSIKICQSSLFAPHRLANLNALSTFSLSLMYKSKSGANDKYDFDSAAKS